MGLCLGQRFSNSACPLTRRHEAPGTIIFTAPVRQLTIKLDPGDNCFVCGEVPARLLSKLSWFRSAVTAHDLRR